MFRVPEITYLKYVVEAATVADGGCGGIVSRFEQGGLRLMAHHGVSELFVAATLLVPQDADTSCAQAARERRRVVIRDVQEDEGFAPYLGMAELGGFRSVQSIPLVNTRRQILGVLSTLYAEPHHPTPESLVLLDACALVASRLIEAADLHADIDAGGRRTGLPPRPLSRAAAQAADAARTLLPALPREGGLALLDNTARHLTLVIDDLALPGRAYSAIA